MSTATVPHTAPSVKPAGSTSPLSAQQKEEMMDLAFALADVGASRAMRSYILHIYMTRGYATAFEIVKGWMQ